MMFIIFIMFIRVYVYKYLVKKLRPIFHRLGIKVRKIWKISIFFFFKKRRFGVKVRKIWKISVFFFFKKRRFGFKVRKIWMISVFFFFKKRRCFYFFF